jgi:NitT/TauT family transport system ATP-binding protein
MSSNEESFIRLDNLTFSYGEKMILNKVNLKLEKGASYAVIGKSGVGKSTLLHLIAGFLKPTSGSIYIDQQKNRSSQKEHCLFVSGVRIISVAEGGSSCRMPLRLNNSGKTSEIQNRVLSILKEMDLDHLRNKYPEN